MVTVVLVARGVGWGCTTLGHWIASFKGWVGGEGVTAQGGLLLLVAAAVSVVA